MSGGSAGANAQAARTTHARTGARAGGRAGGRAARARRARTGRHGAAVFGCSLRAHHSPDSASSRTREPVLRQRPPERMRDRDFDREPDEPGVCGLDGSGRAGERSGVRQLMGVCRCGCCPSETCAAGGLVSLGQMQSEERVLTRGPFSIAQGEPARPHLAPPSPTFSLSSCACGRARHILYILTRHPTVSTPFKGPSQLQFSLSQGRFVSLSPGLSVTAAVWCAPARRCRWSIQ